MKTYTKLIKKFTLTHGHVGDIFLLNEDFVQDNAASPTERNLFNSKKYSFMIK
jgi:hypothetical protein